MSETASDLTDLCRIRATSIMGWPVWVVSVGEPIDGEYPVKMINNEHRGKVFIRSEAEAVLPLILKVRDDATIVAIGVG